MFMWIGKRSETKQTWPGKLDNTVSNLCTSCSVTSRHFKCMKWLLENGDCYIWKLKCILVLDLRSKLMLNITTKLEKTDNVKERLSFEKPKKASKINWKLYWSRRNNYTEQYRIQFLCLAMCNEYSSSHSTLCHLSNAVLFLFLSFSISVELCAFWAFLLEDMANIGKLGIDFFQWIESN